MKNLNYLFILFLIASCTDVTPNLQAEISGLESQYCDDCDYTLDSFYYLHNLDTDSSISIGSPGNGKLVHGKILPHKGPNFFYFDSVSYINARAFTHGKVRNILIDTYDSLGKYYAGRQFGLMEGSNKNGGKIYPHKTHQNGLSIDLMYPKLKNGKVYTALDKLGAQHYLLDFDEHGKLSTDENVEIDFNTTAHHIYLLEKSAENYGFEIEKVIMYTEFKDELFASKYGKKLKAMNIYFAQTLPKVVNKLHDDHFHVDFSPMN